MLRKIVIGLLCCFFVLPSVQGKEFLEKREFEKYFGNYTGTFVLYDDQKDQYVIYNPKQSDKRIAPCSSSKIYNALIGLETGVIKDGETMFVWDGKVRSLDPWNQNHTLFSAMRYSVVWYFQNMMFWVGEEKTQYYYDMMDYGNKDISGGNVFEDINGKNFWIDSTLKINAREQVELLRKLYSGQLPFQKRNVEIVLKSIELSKGEDWHLSGKTGSGKQKGWFVGYLSKEGASYYFAVNIEGLDSANGVVAKGIAENILREMSLLP